MAEQRVRDLLIYDGDCGVCDEGVKRMRARMNPPVEIRALQSIDASAVGVPADVVLNEGPVLTRQGGEYLVGPAAIAEVMSMSGSPYTAVARVMSAPGINQFLTWIGPKLYRQRYRMPGASDSCQVPATR